MSVPSYRDIAGRTLSQAASELNQIPTGRLPTDVLIAHATKAQAVATIAVAQALLHIADVLDASLSSQEGGQPRE